MIEPARPHYDKLAETLDALGNAETLKILNQATKGFVSGKATIKELNLTPRKYYRNLKKLIDLEIVASQGNTYRLTPRGVYLHKTLINDVSTVLLANQTLMDPLKKLGSKGEVTIIDNYKDLVTLLTATVEKSKSEVLLATKYLDLVVVQSLIFALQRNVKLKTITSEKIDLANLKMLAGFVRNIRPVFLKFFLGGESNYRWGEVPMSFVVIDGEIAIFEIPNKEFKLAFVSADKEVAKPLTRLFMELWNQSQVLKMPSL